jgi:beta-N-acetylhexosaminidase
MHRASSGPHGAAAAPGHLPGGVFRGLGEVWALREALFPSEGASAGTRGRGARSSASAGHTAAVSRRGSPPLRTPRLWIAAGAVIVVALAVVVGARAAAGRTPVSPRHAATAGGSGNTGGSGNAGATSASATGHATSGDRAAAGHSAAAGASGAAGPAGQAAAGAAAVIPRLTARQLAGQRVIYSYSGLTPPASLLSAIRHGEAAGVIFFSGNISSLAQIAGVTRELERADTSRLNPVRAPLLLMTDQEGGIVRRLPGAPYLSEKQIGQAAHPAAQARIAGRGAAANLRGVGMNVNLAPVLDVFRAPGNFIDQYGRSYSSSGHKASYLGADFIMAQQAGGAAATAKHFPGLGAAAASQNTDERPVTLNLSAAAIRSVDERPYKSAIAAGVRLVMASWAIYPSLDPHHPAGLSSAIVQGELRKRLGFRGVTITDALEAGALRPFGSIGHRSQLAAQAGMDLLLCSGQSASEGQQAADALENGYRDGHLGHQAFRGSVTRILELRTSLAS